MPLPSTVRVKLSSEAAGYVSITPVVQQELPIAELIGRIAAATGKDGARIAEMFKRGSLVSGATRFRWEGREMDSAEVADALAMLPDAEPYRPFDWSKCSHVVLHGGANRIEITQEAGVAKRFLQRRTFWDALASFHPEYAEYSYKAKADVYRTLLRSADRELLAQASALLKFPGLGAQVKSGRFDSIEFYLVR